MSRVRNLVDFTAQTHDFDGDSTLDLNVTGTITSGGITSPDVPKVDLTIAPEVLEIQVAAPAAGQATTWLWSWLQSTLPYARREITNSPENQVPLYLQGTYTVNNYAAYDLFDQMTQTHSLYLKWIDGAGTDNLVSWATSTGPVSDSHPDINGGNATDVQRLSINVPSTITLPTLTAPSVSYTVTNNGSSAYTFSGSASGDNPQIGPFYRGGTYTFNVSATGHPLYLTTDNGTNFSAGTYFGEYTDGVTGSRTDSGSITFTVPSGAPDTLYYQCGNHAGMFGAITIKDLEVETNNNGNYVVYFQHTQEGHKTPVELRPIPSLVNQMCIVYDANAGKFVPQDLATYVENTPSFENKIREVAGTAELVVEDGSAVVAKVNVYYDSTYLPLVGNNAGDQAFATDNNTLYIWDGNTWESTKQRTTDTLTEGSTNLYYTDARVDARMASGAVGDLIVGGNLTVNGTTTTINSTSLSVDDLNILLASGAADNTAANGAGITVDGSSATLLYNSLYDSWAFNKELRLLNNKGLFWDVAAGGASLGLKADTSDNITFRTGGFWDRLVIADSGYVGVGTNNPLSGMHISDGTNAGAPQNGGRKSTLMIDSGASASADLQFMVRDGYNSHIFFGDTNDPNIGMIWYDHSSNHMNFLANTNHTMTIDDNGRVGIGTNDPSSTLDVRGNIQFGPAGTNYAVGDIVPGTAAVGQVTKFRLYNSNEFQFQTYDGSNYNTAIHVDTGARVGIGTDDPHFAKLTVNTPRRTDGETNRIGQMVVAGPISDAPSHDFTNSTAIFRVHGTDATNNLQFGVGAGAYNYHPWIQGSYDNTSNNGSKDILLQPIGGNIGIGTTSPDGPLHIKSGNNVTLKLDATLADGSGSFTSQSFARNGTNKWRIFQYGDDSRLAFINDQAGNYEQLSLAANGSVGIGTTNPVARTHIHGSGDLLRLTSTNSGSGGAQLDLIHQTPSPADGDINALINMGGYYSGTSSAYATSIRSVWSNAGGRQGRFEFYTRNAGDFNKQFQIEHDGDVYQWRLNNWEPIVATGYSAPNVTYTSAQSFDITPTANAYAGVRTNSSKYRYVRIEADIRSDGANHYGFFWGSDQDNLGYNNGNAGYKWVYRGNDNRPEFRGISSNSTFKHMNYVDFAYNDGVFHRWVIEVTPSGVRLYVDGEFVDSLTNVYTPQGYCGIHTYSINDPLYCRNVSITSLDSLQEETVYTSTHQLAGAADGIYKMVNTQGMIQEVYVSDGWMLVSANDARSSGFLNGNDRRTLAYTVNRNGAEGQFGVLSPDQDYLIGGFLDDFAFSNIKVIAWGFDSTNSTYDFADRGNWVSAEWAASSLTTVVPRASVTIGGTNGIGPSANYFVGDGIRQDYNTGGFSANLNQTTIGGVGVNGSSGDPTTGCYLGHGQNESGSYSEGWYNSGNTSRNCQGYTTWVKS